MNLLACCILLGLSGDAVQERAGTLEFDDGMTRDQANRQALQEALKTFGRVSRRFVDELFEAAGPIFDLEKENGWDRRRTTQELERRLAGASNARA